MTRIPFHRTWPVIPLQPRQDKTGVLSLHYCDHREIRIEEEQVMVLPSSAFEIIFIIYLGFTCLLGGLTGAITSHILRLRWKPVVFFQDVVISGVTPVIFGLVVTEIESKRLTLIENGEVHHSFWTLFFVGLAAPIVRHLIEFIVLRPSSAPSRAR
jgi:hypothetical protein